MRKIFLTTWWVLFGLAWAIAQTASVQVIHNSPTPGTDSGPVVDIYVNGALLPQLTSVPFRAATPFLDVASGLDIEVAVALSPSTSVDDAVAVFPLGALADGVNYTVIANGIVGNVDTPFGLAVSANAREAASGSGVVAINAFHGSSDAPAVDVAARTVGNLFTNLSYGDFSADYLEVPAAQYYLDVKPAGSSAIVATFDANLSALGGGAATVFASGLLGDSPAFGLFAALPNGTVVELPATQVARLQVIHNSPSPTVDVYVNGGLFIDDFVYRTATAFQFVPAGVGLDIAVAPGTSTSAADAIFVAENVTLDNGGSYTVIANGIVGNVDTPFGLAVSANAREAASGSGVVAINAFHGSPNAPAVDVAARTVGNLFTNLSYGGFSADYLEVPAAQYYLDVKPAGSSAIVATFDANLSALGGGAATVFASGLLGDSPAFGLFAALPNGTVVELPAIQLARLQVIHNSPSPTVDVYVNGGLFIDDFVYRTATAFQFVPAGVGLDIAVAPGTSTSAADAIFVAEDVTLDNGGSYTVIANGIVGNVDTPFGLAVSANAREAASGSGVVAINAFHGSPNAPAVDVAARTVGNLFTNLSYGDFSADYLEVPAAQYYLDVKPAGSSAIVATFDANLSALGGGAATVFASGLLGETPAFGLFAALPNGTVVELPAIQLARLQVIHNSPSPTVDVYVNGDLFIDDFVYRTATAFQFVPAGVGLDIAVAPGTSTSAADAIFVAEDVTLDSEGSYTVIANGIVGNVDTPFGLAVSANAREAASGSGVVAINAFHGSPNAPAVDVAARTVGNLFTNLSYGGFSADYLEVPAAQYYLDVKPAGSSAIVATFDANLSALGGGAATVFASGLLGDSPAFGLFAALPNGTVVELPAIQLARLQVIHNSPSPTVDVYVNGDLFIDDFVYRTATAFQFVPAGVGLDIAVAPGTSTSAADAIFVAEDVTLDNGGSYTVIANGIVGNVDTPFGLAVSANAREAASGSGVVAINAFHGSPNAPAVDVAARTVGNLFTNLSYGGFSADYLEVPAAQYYLDVKPAGSSAIVATFDANLSALGGGAATVFASGLLGDSPAFGLFAALPNGTVVELPATQVARLQVIHNSPSPTVDVYVNGALFIDDFVYRTATAFQFVPAGVGLDIAVAPGTSTSAADAIFVAENVTLDNGGSYTVIANGIVGNVDTPFGLAVSANAREAASGSGVVAINAFHGSPNAPAVDVAARTVGNLFTNLSYGGFSADYLEVPAAQYYLDVKPAGSSAIVATFDANLSALGGGAATVFASGLLGETPAFGLFAALPNGTVVELPATQVARLQVIHNSPSPTVDVYVNGDLFIDDFTYLSATPFGFVPAGTPLTVGVALGNSTSAADVIVDFGVTLDNGETYIAVANGQVGSPEFPFELAILDAARESSSDPDVFEAAVFHGSPGAPAVDIADFVAGELINNLAYGEFTGYAGLEAITHVLEVRPAGDPSLVGSFLIDLEGAEGLSALVFAGGLLGEEPLFNLYAALPNGTVIPFVPVSQMQLIHNSPAPIASVVDLYAAINPTGPQSFGPLFDDVAFRSATPYLFYPTRLPITIGVAGGNSAGPQDILLTLPAVTFEDGKLYTAIANGLPGDATYPFGLAITDEARPFTDNPSQIGIRAFHGSPGAPGVDVDVRGVGQIISDLAYGSYSGYLEASGNLGYLEVNPAGSDDLVGTFEAGDLSILNGLGLTVFASGILGEEPAFGLFAALPSGQVVELNPVSRVQIIHNAPSPTVDVFINGDLAVPNFAFRTATPLIDLPTRTSLDIAVAPAGAGIGSAVATYNDVVLEDGKVYTVMATGIVGDVETPFELLFNDEARDRASGIDQVDVVLYHGSPDAPEVDVILTGGAVLFDNTAYGEFSDYISVPAASYSIDITPANDNSVTVRRYTADLTSIPGEAITVFASGFLVQGTPVFETWVAFSNGITAPLSEIVSTREPNVPIGVYQLVPNPASSFSRLNYELLQTSTIDITVTNLMGQVVYRQSLGQQSAGIHQLDLPVSNWVSGTYQVSLRTSEGVINKSLVVVKQ